MKSFKDLINKQQQQKPETSQSKPPPPPPAPILSSYKPPSSLIKKLETTVQASVPTASVPTASVPTASVPVQVKAVVKPKERYAFAIIHFGSNPVYLELEMYFFKMLRQNTSNDIIYLYSVNDTPPAFVDAIRPLVTEVVSYDDKHITYDVTFNSGYSNFNTLRTCNFIFAYTLKKYNRRSAFKM